MFVDIENFKSVVAIENLLIPYKRGRLAPDKKSYLPKETITPDVCFEVLRSTNAPRNIKDMLVCISELPIPEQAQFKNVVLSTFTQREQPKDILILAEKLAHVSNYEKELSETKELNEGEFLLSSISAERGYATTTSFMGDDLLHEKEKQSVPHIGDAKVVFLSQSVNLMYSRKFSPILDFSYAKFVKLSLADLSGIKKIIFAPNTEIWMQNVKNLPPNLDFSQCQTLHLNECDISDYENWKFNSVLRLNLNSSKKLPEKMFFENIKYLDLGLCDFLEVKQVQFHNIGILDLSSAKNLPSNLDFSQCEWLVLNGVDLGKFDSLKLSPNAHLDLTQAKNIPQSLELSKYRYLNLSYLDLKQFPNLCFAEGASLVLRGSFNFPEVFDVSHLRKVDFFESDLSNCQEVIFRDKKQMKDANFKDAFYWKGKVSFTHKETSVFNKMLGMFQKKSR